MSDLPEEARRRRMILVVGDNEYDDLQVTTAGEHLVRDDTVSILRWPLEPARTRPVVQVASREPTRTWPDPESGTSRQRLAARR